MAGADGRSTLSDAGFFSIWRDSSRIGAGSVAEKKSVCETRRQVLEHPADVGQEAHVEHAVGLVEHQDLEAGEAGVGLLEVVQQAARAGDDDVDAGAQGALLRAHADAAVDGGGADAACARPRSLKCSTICAASSRVGARTSARVMPRFLPRSRCRMGSAKAAVLPLPVMAQASTSRPSRAGGMASR